MADIRERRRRQPKRPAVYLTLLVLGGALALGAAWQATRPATVISREFRAKSATVSDSNGRSGTGVENRLPVFHGRL